MPNVPRFENVPQYHQSRGMPPGPLPSDETGHAAFSLDGNPRKRFAQTAFVAPSDGQQAIVTASYEQAVVLPLVQSCEFFFSFLQYVIFILIVCFLQ